MSKKMFSRERERGKLRFSALLILIGLLLFGCDPTMVTITYNANGGKGEMKPQAVESGVEVKLSANTFTKDDSDFTGWNEAADGSGKAYADGATVAPTGNLTLYAQWQVKSAPENPGTEDPGTENPGTEDPDPENPGTEDPVVLEDHITNLALIQAVEETYRLSGSEIGWTKTADGYVDMTNETNKTLVEGVTSLAPNGDMYLNGIEYFTGLQELRLLNNSVLTELPDLTRLSNLRTLAVTTFESEADSESTAVSSLTAVSGLPSSLVTLDLSENKLTELDVSKLTKLEELDLSENKLTAISDLPVSLKRLKLYTNKLTTLNVSKLTDLTYLDVSDNELTELDITNNAQLTLLLCFNNRMTALDITNVTAFSQAPLPSTSILACGLQRNDNGTLTLTATQEQQTALAPLFPSAENPDEQLTFYQASNFGVVWDVPKAELDLTAGTAVFNKTTGLTLSFSGSTLPADASASVSLGGAEVNSEHVSISGNAVVVALAALTNDTVDMTVTVTVSAEGYNNAVLPYEGVSTVWMPENVTAALADSEAKIGGETVTVTVSQTDGSDSLDAVRILSGTYSNGTSAALAIGGDGRSFTAPILADAPETGTTVTISLVLGKENAAGSDTVTADNLSLTVYPSTHVRYDGRIFQQVKGFDFSTENTAKTAGVQIFKEIITVDNSSSWEENSDWSDVQYISGEGYQFATTSGSGGMRFVFPEGDGDLDFELIMVEAKWNNNSQANLHMSYWYANSETYGYSFYKTGQSFFMVGGYNFAEEHGFNANVTENTFNRFYAFDNGANHSGRVNDGEVHSFTLSAPNNRTLDTLDKLQLEFSKKVECTYTLKTVNFYKPLSN